MNSTPYRVCLYSARRHHIALTVALQGAAAGTPLTGFCYSPREVFFVRWDGQTLVPVSDADLGQVYEARLFAKAGELRWLRDPESADGQGKAVWLTETAVDLPGWKPLAPLTNLEPIAGQRLLTGSLGNPIGAGWSKMHAPRHGEVPVPVVGATGSRLGFALREYLGPAAGTAGEDGNRLVVEERLLGIVVLNNTGGQ